jgi:hypothetical protein
MWRRIAREVALCMLAIAFATSVGHTYDPRPTMNAELRATNATLELYVPKSGQEYQLLDALVKSGAFSNGPTGLLANERILRVPSASGGGVSSYLVLAQYFDPTLGQEIAHHRAEVTKAYLSKPALSLQLTSVERVVADFGWEQGKSPQVEMLSGRSVNTIIDKKMSISFLKIGYVGQSATVTFFPIGTKMEQVFAESKADPNVAGATIYLDKTQNQYVMYSEFFRAPKVLASKAAMGSALAGSLLDHQPAIVVENYEAR